jgi:hypothetical protein
MVLDADPLPIHIARRRGHEEVRDRSRDGHRINGNDPDRRPGHVFAELATIAARFVGILLDFG